MIINLSAVFVPFTDCDCLLNRWRPNPVRSHEQLLDFGSVADVDGRSAQARLDYKIGEHIGQSTNRVPLNAPKAVSVRAVDLDSSLL